MAKGTVNKVMLIGRLGKDPEVKKTQAGKTITNISIATVETIKDKVTGTYTDVTEWHRVVFFDKLGDIAAQYLKKGSKVFVEGRMQTQKWQDKETGQDRYGLQIIGANLQLLGDKKDGQEPNGNVAHAPIAEDDDEVPF